MPSKRASQLRQRYKQRKVRARLTRVVGASRVEDEDGRTFLLPQKVHATMVFPTLRCVGIVGLFIKRLKVQGFFSRLSIAVQF
jgi:hypothetical protein